jgi:hypothetical protein
MVTTNPAPAAHLIEIGRGERQPRRLEPQLRVGQAAQLVVDMGKQSLGRIVTAGIDIEQKLRDRCRVCHDIAPLRRAEGSLRIESMEDGV